MKSYVFHTVYVGFVTGGSEGCCWAAHIRVGIGPYGLYDVELSLFSWLFVT
jgi:hypothetical protein